MSKCWLKKGKDGGVCWRCESVVIQKELEQWFFRITHYAQELLDGCDRLTSWPARVLAMQRHWIGRSQGVEIDFPVTDPTGQFYRPFVSLRRDRTPFMAQHS